MQRFWPQRPRYFAAAVAVHREGGSKSEEGCDIQGEGGKSSRVTFPQGVTLTCDLMGSGVTSGGMGVVRAT